MKSPLTTALRLVMAAWMSLPQSGTGQCTVAFQNCPASAVVVDCDNSGDEKISWPVIVANPANFCTNYAVAQTGGPPPGTVLPIGQYNISYIALANDINSPASATVFCNFNVNIVKDQQAPVFAFCPPDITVLGIDNGNGNCSAQAYWANPIVSDNCGTIAAPVASAPCGSTFPNGTTSVSFTASDASGNTSICSFSITVNCITPVRAATDLAIRVYPNPSDGKLLIDIPDLPTADLRFFITDLTGKVVLEKQAEPGERTQTIQGETLPAGLYFLRLVSSGVVLGTAKFVKD